MSAKIVFVFASVLLIGSLAINVYQYSQLCSLSAGNNLQSQVDELISRLENLQNEKASLQDQLQTLSAQTRVPNLVTRLGAKDVRASPYMNHPWSGQLRLYVEGAVWNVGNGTAVNGRLHVTLYQGANIANETDIELGTIEPGAYVKVASDIYYEGTALTNWTIIPEFE